MLIHISYLSTRFSKGLFSCVIMFAQDYPLVIFYKMCFLLVFFLGDFFSWNKFLFYFFVSCYLFRTWISISCYYFRTSFSLSCYFSGENYFCTRLFSRDFFIKCVFCWCFFSYFRFISSSRVIYFAREFPSRVIIFARVYHYRVIFRVKIFFVLFFHLWIRVLVWFNSKILLCAAVLPH
jgi:hypothetical protein